MRNIILSLIILTFSTPAFAVEDWQLKSSAERSLKARLKDPDSAKILGMVVFDNVVCGSFNAKNSFGGYGGETLFISAGSAETTFIESDIKPDDFEYVWNQKCK